MGIIKPRYFGGFLIIELSADKKGRDLAEKRTH